MLTRYPKPNPAQIESKSRLRFFVDPADASLGTWRLFNERPALLKHLRLTHAYEARTFSVMDVFCRGIVLSRYKRRKLVFDRALRRVAFIVDDRHLTHDESIEETNRTLIRCHILPALAHSINRRTARSMS